MMELLCPQLALLSHGAHSAFPHHIPASEPQPATFGDTTFPPGPWNGDCSTSFAHGHSTVNLGQDNYCGNGTAFPNPTWNGVCVGNGGVASTHSSALPVSGDAASSAQFPGTAFPHHMLSASSSGAPGFSGHVSGSWTAFPDSSGTDVNESIHCAENNCGMDGSLAANSGGPGVGGHVAGAATAFPSASSGGGGLHCAGSGCVDSSLAKTFTSPDGCLRWGVGADGHSSTLNPCLQRADAGVLCTSLPRMVQQESEEFDASCSVDKVRSEPVSDTVLLELLMSGSRRVLSEEELLSLYSAPEPFIEAKTPTARASPGHITACGPACLYGIVAATSHATSKGELASWRADFAQNSHSAAAALSPVAAYLVACGTGADLDGSAGESA
mmetsp:Transcript_40435/g.108567  ORF Transcript_40435/g.108567 Transcript_40435/m.108567 type:complete len:385 (+) Transcript_40435:3-1157(+)